MDEATFVALLKKGAQHAASDVLLKVGRPPAFRVGGRLHYLQGEPLRPEQTHMIAEIVLRGTRFGPTLAELSQSDSSYAVPGLGRYRVNVYRQRGTIALALRAIPDQVPTLEQLGLPPVVGRLAELERGLILVVGAAGNGKSTTLATMIAHINHTRRVHIVTIEDPIEFMHVEDLACISQREIGIDVEDFATGLRAALRQGPDVILLGEIRDEASMDIALKAAETGHLVLSTMHTPDVARTVGRVLALATERQTSETRERFAANLKAIIAQRLLPAPDGRRRTLATEILVVTGTARETLRRPEGNVPLKDVMEQGVHPYGMHTFEMSIRQLLEASLVDTEAARASLA